VYRRITLISLAIFGILLGAAWMTPDTWVVDEARVMDASPDIVWPFVSDAATFSEWTVWTPEHREGLDSEDFETTGGLRGYRWSSARSMGEITTRAVESGRVVALAGSAEGRFPIDGSIVVEEQEDGGVVVRWTHEGELGWDPLMRLLRPVVQGRMAEDVSASLGRLGELAEEAQRAATPHPDAPIGTLAPSPEEGRPMEEEPDAPTDPAND